MKNKMSKSSMHELFRKMIGDENIKDSIKINFYKNNEINILKPVYFDSQFEILNTQNNMSQWAVLDGPKTIWEKALIAESMALLSEMMKNIKKSINIDNSHILVRRKKHFDPCFIRAIEKTNEWNWKKCFLRNHIIINDEKDILKFNEPLYKAIILGREGEKIKRDKNMLLNILGRNNDKEFYKKI